MLRIRCLFKTGYKREKKTAGVVAGFCLKEKSTEYTIAEKTHMQMRALLKNHSLGWESCKANSGLRTNSGQHVQTQKWRESFSQLESYFIRNKFLVFLQAKYAKLLDIFKRDWSVLVLVLPKMLNRMVFWWNILYDRRCRRDHFYQGYEIRGVLIYRFLSNSRIVCQLKRVARKNA